MTFSCYARWVWRESRGAGWRLAFFVACLAVGVAGVVCVAGLSSGVEEAIRADARQLLGGDLSLRGRRPLSPDTEAVLRGLGSLPRVDVRELPTMASAPNESPKFRSSLLVELKAVSPGYPLYGAVVLDPPVSPAHLLDDFSAVVAPELLGQLGLAVGDAVRLGGADFRIAGTVLGEPDRVGFSLSFGPRVLISVGGLARTGLERFGSRILYRSLFALPEGAGAGRAEEIAARLRRDLPERAFVEVETYGDAQPALRRALQRGTRFLGLVALVSLLVGGIGVAQTVRAWLSERLDAIAVLRCLGLRPREVFSLYLGQTVLLGLAGSVAGAAAGIAVQMLAAGAVGPLLPSGTYSVWQPLSLVRGIVLGVGVAVLFSFPTLAAARRVSPIRVFRRDAEPLQGTRLLRAGSALVLLVGVFVVGAVQAGSARTGAAFAAGLVSVSAVLGLAGFLLTRAAARVPRGLARGRPWLRYGLGALARPGAGTVGSIVGLGLGVLLVLATSLVEQGIRDQIGSEMPADAPTAFFVDIQPDQWPSVEELLLAQGASNVGSVPLVMARLRAVDGHPVEELARRNGEEPGRRRWVLTREQRLTYLRDLPRDNAVVSGRLWSDPDRPEVSVEEEFARDLGAGLGSVLTFDVQGVALDLWVTSIRKVEWRSFGINFFFVVEPGVLDAAPQSRVAAARFPVGGEQRAQDVLASRFSNITVLRVRDILEKVSAVVSRAGMGVRVLGGFTVLAGVVILAGAVTAASVRRGREAALLKALGMTRWGVGSSFAVEHAVVGAVAGVIGSVGGGVVAWAVLTRGMEVEWHLRLGVHATAAGLAAVLAAGAGLAASVRSLRRPPADVLRDE